MESLQRFKIKLLASRYGHPEASLKIIGIAGTSGTTATARLVQEILTTAGLKSAVLTSENPLPAATLYQFLSDAVKEGMTYAVITLPTASLADSTFSGLTFTVAALLHTDNNTSIADGAQPNFAPLFTNQSEHIILNHDDASFNQFNQHKGSVSTLTYGASSGSDVRIESSTLYKKGTEAILSHGPKNFTVASFLTGESAVSTMAAAAAIASALHVTPTAITDGLANYDPNETERK